MKNILVTGYEPWDKFEYNPSGEVAKALDGYSPMPDYTVRGVVMPVNCATMPNILAGLIEQYQPVLVIGLGLAYGDSGIRVERLGHNWLDIINPDNGGNVRIGAILENAPLAYRSPLPHKEIVAALLAAGIPAYVSDHAGGHLCNEMLYTALHLASQMPTDEAPQCGFIHLPAEPRLVANLLSRDRMNRNVASMTLELQQAAIKVAISACL